MKEELSGDTITLILTDANGKEHVIWDIPREVWEICMEND